MSIPESLLKAMHAKRVVPFIGAGFSYFFGNPSWDTLLLSITRHSKINLSLSESDLKGKDPLQVAEALWQFYKKKHFADKVEKFKEQPSFKNIDDDVKLQGFLGSRVNQELLKEFNEIVVECVHENSKETHRKQPEIEKLKLLGDQSFQSIVTTNYDENLEREIFVGTEITFPGVGKELSLNEKGKVIYKIHGHISEPASIVLTHSQYYNFMHNFGYYKSKLYTIFATNVILMLGYGFRDINIHEIYFHFRKDYDGIINEVEKDQPKAFLVLTEHDKNSLGQYYELHKDFLHGCGITVLDEGFSDLPEFVEKLTSELSTYKERLDFDNILSKENYPQIKDAIKRALNREITVVTEHLVADYLKAISKIFTDPTSLMILAPDTEFDFTGQLPDRAGLRLLDSVEAIIREYSDTDYIEEYNEIIYYSMEFANDARYMINDFYYFPDRFKRFLNLCKLSTNLTLPNKLRSKFTEMFGDVLSYSSKEYGKCHGGAILLEEEGKNIPESVVKIYVEGRKKAVTNAVASGDRYGVSMRRKEIDWIEYFLRFDVYSSDFKKQLEGFVTDIKGYIDEGKLIISW
ncbi:SIR2 family protein [Paenibacillus sp. FSL H7-0350]|uniref:SIR2 family NAD-dependent protein deacylase n=1 Tax=Paenibacillus sp. FSL H7-0350 TaxID=2975345 RepID=UPI0031580A22